MLGMATYKMYNSPYVILLICSIALLTGLGMVEGFQLLVNVALLNKIIIDLFGAMIILLLYAETTYTYEIGDDGLRIKTLIRNTLVLYQDIKDVTISKDRLFLPPPYMKLPDDIIKRRFMRGGAFYAKAVVVIDTTTKVPVFGQSIAYVVTPLDTESFVTELKSRLKKT